MGLLRRDGYNKGIMGDEADSMTDMLWSRARFGRAVAAAFLLLNAGCSESETAAAASTDSPNKVVALLDGEPITEEDLGIKGELIQLEQKAYEARQEALDRLVALRLIQREASRHGLGPEKWLEEVVDSQTPEPSPAAVRAYYERRKSRLRQPFEEIRDQVKKMVRNVNLQRARRDYVARLRRGADLEVRIAPPRLPVNVENAHGRGPQDAPVTLVEFSDFQCPYCKRVQPTLAELFEEYEGKLRWVFKDLPLTSIHPGAVRAAEAARCAGEQGRFWEYRGALFELARVTDDVHSEVAQSLELDYEAWETCLDSGKYVAAVEADGAEAAVLGISGTPAFLVNGILITGAQPKESFTRLIEAELSRRGQGGRQPGGSDY